MVPSHCHSHLERVDAHHQSHACCCSSAKTDPCQLPGRRCVTECKMACAISLRGCLVLVMRRALCINDSKRADQSSSFSHTSSEAKQSVNVKGRACHPPSASSKQEGGGSVNRKQPIDANFCQTFGEVSRCRLEATASGRLRFHHTWNQTQVRLRVRERQVPDEASRFEGFKMKQLYQRKIRIEDVLIFSKYHKSMYVILSRTSSKSMGKVLHQFLLSAAASLCTQPRVDI